MTNNPDTKVPPIYELGKHYLDPKHWVRGQKSKIGAASNKLIHIAVGHTLSNWERVEAAASILFSHFVETNSIAAARAYGAILGTRTRQAALRQASETFFLRRRNAFKKNRDVYAEVKVAEKCAALLIHNYGEASSRRNDVAHGIAWELSFKEQKEQTWFLVAPNYQSTRTANWIEDASKLHSAKGLHLSDAKARFDYNKLYYKNSDYVFGTKEIKVFAGKFAFLYAELLSFGHVLDPSKFNITPAQLSELAKKLSA